MTSETGAPARRNRRRFRSYLIKTSFRLRLVLDDALFALVAALAAITILTYVSNRQIGDSLFSAHLSLKETRELLTHGAWIAGAVTFGAVLLFGVWSVIDAHRIAGPIHRLERLLGEIAEGDLTHEIRFRRGDEFQELAAAADRVVDVFAERIRQIQQEAAALQTAARGAPSPETAGAIQTRADALVEQLAFFRVPASAPEVDGRPLG